MSHYFYKSRASSLTNPNYQPTGVRYTPSPQLKQLQGQVDEVNGKWIVLLLYISLVLGSRNNER